MKKKIVVSIVVVVAFALVIVGIINHYNGIIREKDLVIGLLEYHRNQLVEERDYFKGVVYDSINEEKEEVSDNVDEQTSWYEKNWSRMFEDDSFRIDLTDAIYTVLDESESYAEPLTPTYELWQIVNDIYNDYFFER